MSHDILIVDDEPDIRNLVGGLLSDEGYAVRDAANADAAYAALAARAPQLVILDVWLEGSKEDGLQILARIKNDYPQVPVLMISGHGTVKMAVTAIKQGAFDFLEKPFESERLLLLTARALENAQLKKENQELKTRSYAATEIIGTSQAVLSLKSNIEKIGPTNSRVLIMGPPGAGKELAARLLHMGSKRAAGPFVIMNCASLEPDKFDEKLFGSENADGRRMGYLEEAHTGTLLLDEVADLPAETQAKLVRVLQDQSFTRVGGETVVNVDVRVIAASNRDLQELTQAGKFRQDLLYRLNVVPLRLPPLTERREDIPALMQFFLTRAAENSGTQPPRLGTNAEVALQAHDWPGNIRQLRNVAEWLVIMYGGAEKPLQAGDLPPDVQQNTPQVLNWEKGAEIMAQPLREAREVFEREYLLAQLSRFGGNISRTALFVGMERSALHRKLKLLGLSSVDRAAGENAEDIESVNDADAA
ncbi:MAG TPA: sigma-54 dependent transcriptional regulator [Alphaproteobacteria bacterium]|nr:sigma-54 dependent transcriptional regulator [Alphaproteobacteria bacterium]